MQARFTASADFTIGVVDRRLFGSFVEHMGRCVYTGIYEPGHPEADEAGLRKDVLELTREMGVTLVRYPGGNFVSGYRWEDGVGPVEQRPSRLDLAWRSVESNAFGLHEFIGWARKAQVEPMMAVNLGTRGPQEAADLLEYANHPGGTRLSDLRRAHGSPDPFGIRLWCLGNEMDGPWQLGAKTADEYGRLANETAKVMRLVDPTVELVACGSSMRSMATFGSWEATVLDHCFEQVDLLSLHAYYEEHDQDLAGFLATALDMDAFIDEVVATVDHVAAKKRSPKRLRLSFDEWNVWFQRAFAGPEAQTWEDEPRLIEDTYDVAAAVVVGTYLMTLLRHADRVSVACQAQLANVIAPIRTEPGGPAWRQTIFHPFAHAARFARGDVLRLAVSSPTYAAEPYGDVPVLDTVATRDGETGEVTVFAVNRDLTEPLSLTGALHGLGRLDLVEHVTLAADGDARRVNTREQPDAVRPRRADGARVVDGVLHATLPPLSWNVLRLAPVRRGA
ncbi:alpha-N-arabinofuranosidase [Actinotalea sp. Marseille-Q4924]|uniref:arabinosylfuranosidase ArfA n=1 Tax=Actinotalea sp. Marseille-Q4924 TaxID=2866571 RepID=UPI001CE435CE|nr:alpha-N-arabinofuranosidase [Actinotalea sp. Marseille-Q4924]